MRERADLSGDSELLDAYFKTAERWDALQFNADAANKVFEENHAIYNVCAAPTKAGQESHSS